ncbi:MAG TPA: SPASM domain-containing protein [Desulfuromonadaceae bacterium]
MSLGELARPITIYWDVTPPPARTPDYGRLCDQIKEIQPLQLHLLDTGGSTCLKILSQLKGAPLAVVLTTDPAALTTPLIESLQALGLKGLLLQASSCAGLTQAKAVRKVVGGRFATGIAFQVNRENWQELPLVVDFCLQQGFGSLTLPMQRLYGDEPVFRLTVRERIQLTESLTEVNVSALRLTIHDPFLWGAFNPGSPFPGNGCQAANTMLAIAPDSTVYPCPALPLALGSLADTTLKELLTGEAKKSFRTQTRKLPDECRCCDQQAGCHGGCRGRSLILTRDISRPDPACEIVLNQKG